MSRATGMHPALGMGYGLLAGLKVYESPIPLTRTVHKVEPWPIKKKRRGWRVVRHVEEVAYMFNPADFLVGRRGDQEAMILGPGAMQRLAMMTMEKL